MKVYPLAFIKLTRKSESEIIANDTDTEDTHTMSSFVTYFVLVNVIIQYKRHNIQVQIKIEILFNS